MRYALILLLALAACSDGGSDVITIEGTDTLESVGQTELEVIWDDDGIYLGSLIASRLTLAGDEFVWVYLQ